MAFYVIKYDNDTLAYISDAHDMLQECLCKPVKEVDEFNLLPDVKYPRAVYHMPSSKRAWSELPDDWYEHAEDFLPDMEGDATYQFAEYMIRATYK